MVGVPRSRGCLLCVRRRVRCDEGRPGCAKCATYGADCPGYERSLKFVSGKHQVRKKGSAVPGTCADAGVGHPQPRRQPSPGTGTAMAIAERPRRASLSRSNVWSAAPSIPAHPRDCRASYVNAILEMVNRDRQPNDSIFYGSWFHQVPGRLGRKVTLDSAVCSFAMHLLGKSKGNSLLVTQSRQLYGQSLGALQRALDNPTEWRSSETLCTTMVMCLFELFADTSGSSSGWIQHSGAVASLIQQRGIDGSLEPWDKSMLFSFRSIIIMNALFTGTDCFLAKKKWQHVLVENTSLANSPLINAFPPGASAIMDLHVAHMARLPGVMRHGWAIRQAREHGLPVDAAQVSMLRRSALSLHASFTSWFYDAKEFLGCPIFKDVPSDVSGDAPPSPYATVLTYENPWIASTYLSYATSMLVVQECLNQCAMARFESDRANRSTRPTVAPSSATTTADTNAADATPRSTQDDHTAGYSSTSGGRESASLGSSKPGPATTSSSLDATPPAAALPGDPTALPPFDTSNRVLCRIIFRSFEKLSGTLMSQYRLGYCMRVSYEFADVPTQMWIRSLLEQSVKTYASARAEAYPTPKPNEYNYN